MVLSFKLEKVGNGIKCFNVKYVKHGGVCSLMFASFSMVVLQLKTVSYQHQWLVTCNLLPGWWQMKINFTTRISPQYHKEWSFVVLL